MRNDVCAISPRILEAVLSDALDEDWPFQAFVKRLNLAEYWEVYGPPDDCLLKEGKIARW